MNSLDQTICNVLKQQWCIWKSEALHVCECSECYVLKYYIILNLLDTCKVWLIYDNDIGISISYVDNLLYLEYLTSSCLTFGTDRSKAVRPHYPLLLYDCSISSCVCVCLLIYLYICCLLVMMLFRNPCFVCGINCIIQTIIYI